jgi:TolA-binding protein
MTSLLNGRDGRRWSFRLALPALLCAALAAGPLAAQMTADQAAEILLNSARKAYNDRDYPFAATRFREFLGKYGGHRLAPSARYGLALALLGGPQKDYPAAFEQLQPIAGNKDLPEHPFVLYYLGVAQRGLGERELEEAAAKPQEAAQRRNAANQRFEVAGKQFAAAAAAFTARAKPVPADAKELPAELEQAIRARCDLADMQLRTRKPKEARATALALLKDPMLPRSKFRPLALYYDGFASFLLDDFDAAGRSLNRLAPFTDPVFGTHARYLLARVHHQSGEHAEAARHYEAVQGDYAKQRQAAAEALKQPDRFKNDPDEKARLEALVRNPPPEHVARSAFFEGVLLYEGGRFADAVTRFGSFAQQYPRSPLLPEAQLRHGFCLVQLKQYPQAISALQPLVDKAPHVADQALLWLGKAQAGNADPNNVPAREQALRTAMDTFRRAADRSQQLAGSDPGAKLRRGEILLELADTQQLARQYKEAAATYDQVLNEKALPGREEEVLQHLADALHLAGHYARSDQTCDRFQKAHPRSPLLPAILFRHAENAYFVAQAAEKNPNLPNRTQELARLNEEAARRYQAVVDKFPEFPQVNAARYALALLTHRRGDFEKARGILEAIPQAERSGELAVTAYLLADCLMRTAPAKADDALAAGRLQEQLRAAAELLDGFVNAQPGAPQAADALLKLGLCHQRLAGVLVQPEERSKELAAARAAYERLIQQFPKHPLLPEAVMERAKCLAQAGDKQGAMNELRRFTNDPLKATSVAPLALLQLATLLREQNKPDEAAKVLADCRQQHEPALLKDATRSAWVPLIQYHHGVALREAGRFAEARAVLDQVVKQHAGRLEAVEATLRWGQTLQQEGMQKIETARKRLATPNLKPEESAAAQRTVEEGMKAVRDAAQHFEAQAAQLKPKEVAAEVRARMLYEAAWAYRTLAESEVAATREHVRQERAKPTAAKGAPVAEVTLTDVPLQPAEKKAREQYQALVADCPDAPLAIDARFELTELLAERGEHDAGIKLLNEALDKEPPAELGDRIRLRLGACLAAKKDAKAALGQFDAVAQNPKSPLAAEAQYRSGECLIRLGDHEKAAARFAVFRDKPEFQNVPGVTDRALLRLGHALAHLGRWDQSRQAHEQVVGRFGNGPWANEARYGIGWAWQNQKQYDNAVNAYGQVTAATASEVAARAQLQIGLCRLDQKRYPEAANALLVVPYTYDYPHLSAAALCEAARSFVELKQRDQAEKLLRRVIRDHADSKWAEVAKERLEALKKG